MVRTHPSTPEQRAQWTAYMLAHQGEYGVVTHLSRAHGISRPTLYAWREQAERALLHSFTPTRPPPIVTPALERQVLTMLVTPMTVRAASRPASKPSPARGSVWPRLRPSCRRRSSAPSPGSKPTSRPLDERWRWTKSMPATDVVPI